MIVRRATIVVIVHTAGTVVVIILNRMVGRKGRLWIFQYGLADLCDEFTPLRRGQLGQGGVEVEDTFAGDDGFGWKLPFALFLFGGGGQRCFLSHDTVSLMLYFMYLLL